jgi:hypothetical protein
MTSVAPWQRRLCRPPSDRRKDRTTAPLAEQTPDTAPLSTARTYPRRTCEPHQSRVVRPLALTGYASRTQRLARTEIDGVHRALPHAHRSTAGLLVGGRSLGLPTVGPSTKRWIRSARSSLALPGRHRLLGKRRGGRRQAVSLPLPRRRRMQTRATPRRASRRPRIRTRLQAPERISGSGRITGAWR